MINLTVQLSEVTVSLRGATATKQSQRLLCSLRSLAMTPCRVLPKAQTTFETCVFIIVLIAGTLAMNGYFRRALQHNWRTNADSFSNEQYDGKSCPDSGVKTIIKSPKLSVMMDGKEIFPKQFGDNLKYEDMGIYRTEVKNEDDWW